MSNLDIRTKLINPQSECKLLQHSFTILFGCPFDRKNSIKMKKMGNEKDELISFYIPDNLLNLGSMMMSGSGSLNFPLIISYNTTILSKSKLFLENQ